MALPSSRVITLIDIGLSVNEHYVQFVPPATFGVIYDSALKTIQLVRANGQRTLLRKTGDKMYTLRGFLGLRRRECKRLELRWEIEDEIIRCVLTSFGSLEKLKAAVWKYCPNTENAEVITQLWAPEVFDAIELGMSSIFISVVDLQMKQSKSSTLSAVLLSSTRVWLELGISLPPRIWRSVILPDWDYFLLRPTWKDPRPYSIIRQTRKVFRRRNCPQLVTKKWISP